MPVLASQHGSPGRAASAPNSFSLLSLPSCSQSSLELLEPRDTETRPMPSSQGICKKTVMWKTTTTTKRTWQWKPTRWPVPLLFVTLALLRVCNLSLHFVGVSARANLQLLCTYAGVDTKGILRLNCLFTWWLILYRHMVPCFTWKGVWPLCALVWLKRDSN